MHASILRAFAFQEQVMRLLYVLAFMYMSCNNQPEPSPIVSKSPSQVPALVTKTTAPSEHPDILELRKQFMASPFVFRFPYLPVTVNTYPTTYYQNRLPRATVLGDYNENPFYCWM